MDKTLFYIASPRTFSLFWQWANRVNFVDKLIVKNHLLEDAHKIATEYFLSHKKYKYLIISCDDVLGSPDHVRMLIKDANKHKFPVISGWHNVAIGSPWASISMKPHKGIKTKISKHSDYHFINMRDVILCKYGFPFIKAWYVGLPFTLITRETLEKVPLRPFRRTKDMLCKTPETIKNGRGHMFDLGFAIDCAKKNIPITVDARLFLLHFKPVAGQFKKLLHKRKKEVKFIRATVK